MSALHQDGPLRSWVTLAGVLEDLAETRDWLREERECACDYYLDLPPDSPEVIPAEAERAAAL